METKLYLYGASGHCKVVIDILKSNQEVVTAILDDNPKTEVLLDVSVIPSREFVFEKGSKLIVSIGDNAIRKKIVQRLRVGFHLAIHPKTIISSFSSI
ncbi:MAG: hypothetical protein B7Y83_04190, partial [Flavobacteriales bacterium 32-34-25]